MGKASTKAQNRYIEKAYDRIALVVRKGEKENIRQHAASAGESLNQYILSAVTTRMNENKEEVS